METTQRDGNLTELGFDPHTTLLWNLTEPRLYQDAVRSGNARVAQGGALVVDTTPYTGRSPKDKFIVREPSVEQDIAWGNVNRPFDADAFDRLYERVREHLAGSPLYVQDLYGGAEPAHRLPIRFVTDSAWHALFARNMLIRITDSAELERHTPEFTIVHAPEFQAVPERDGTRSEVFVIVNFARKMVLIGGTRYAGEVKKSVFTLLNYLLPKRGVLAMHCSANVGADGDTALFFGLSGTGKTTLSADPQRPLIGDDEHGWSDDGIFNFEGGCYAKMIHLRADHEPEIHATTHMFGTVLENVVMHETTGVLDLDDASLTENTRGAYPITHLPNIVASGHAGHPRNIVFLTCDAFGVLPPISLLNPDQAMYYFLSGYTAKVAGTERGVSEPQATFSACFGEPFLPLNPGVYAEMLGEKIRSHGPKVWLVNTGWTAGAYGDGHRIPIPNTRAMIRGILGDKIDASAMDEDPIFRLRVPRDVPDVPRDMLTPRSTWGSEKAFEEQAYKLASMFRENFRRYEDEVTAAVRDVAPVCRGTK